MLKKKARQSTNRTILTALLALTVPKRSLDDHVGDVKSNPSYKTATQQ